MVDVRFGDHMSGHSGLAHGGAIAAVFDDSLGALFFSACKTTGFTANLSVDYRKPTPIGKDLHLRAWVERIEGRKVFLRAVLEGAEDGAVHAEATALFIKKAVPLASRSPPRADAAGTPPEAASGGASAASEGGAAGEDEEETVPDSAVVAGVDDSRR